MLGLDAMSSVEIVDVGIWFVSCNILYNDEVLRLLLLWMQHAMIYTEYRYMLLHIPCAGCESYAEHRHWQRGCYSTHVVMQGILWDYILRGCSCSM